MSVDRTGLRTIWLECTSCLRLFGWAYRDAEYPNHVNAKCPKCGNAGARIPAKESR